MIETKIQAAGKAVPAGRRMSARDSLFLAATIRRAVDPETQSASVRVRNLSAVGVMADYAGAAVEGDAVVITLRGIGTVNGKVAWLKRGQIGITFDSEVDPMKARRPVNQAPEPRLQRPL